MFSAIFGDYVTRWDPRAIPADLALGLRLRIQHFSMALTVTLCILSLFE